MTREVWKPVVGYEGYYEVSNAGRVRGVDRLVARGNRPMQRRGAILSPIATNRGYLKVELSCSGRQRSFTVHSLVAAAFLGPRPAGFVVMHKDDDQQNNKANNLAYGTQQENVRSAVSSGRSRSSSKYSGVSRCTDRDRWHATATVNGKRLQKRFIREDDAARQVAEWNKLK